MECLINVGNAIVERHTKGTAKLSAELDAYEGERPVEIIVTRKVINPESAKLIAAVKRAAKVE